MSSVTRQNKRINKKRSRGRHPRRPVKNKRINKKQSRGRRPRRPVKNKNINSNNKVYSKLRVM